MFLTEACEFNRRSYRNSLGTSWVLSSRWANMIMLWMELVMLIACVLFLSPLSTGQMMLVKPRVKLPRCWIHEEDQYVDKAKYVCNATRLETVFDGGDVSFWTDIFGVKWKHFKRQDPHFHLNALGIDSNEMGDVYSTMTNLVGAAQRAMEFGPFPQGTVDIHTSAGLLMDEVVARNTTQSVLSTMLSLAAGESFVFRLEYMPHGKSLQLAPLFALMAELTRITGHISDGHIYVAAQEGSRALKPHIDPYDVFILQLFGSKNWTVCVPNVYDPVLTAISASPAERSIAMQLSGEHKVKNRFSEEDLINYDCSSFTLHAGDSLYMPYGTVHYAVGNSESMHYTGSMIRNNVEWKDCFLIAANLTSCTGTCYDALSQVIQFTKDFSLGYEIRKIVPYLSDINQGLLSAEDFTELKTKFKGLISLTRSATDRFFHGNGAGKKYYDAIDVISKVDLSKLFMNFMQAVRERSWKRLNDATCCFTDDTPNVSNMTG